MKQNILQTFEAGNTAVTFSLMMHVKLKKWPCNNPMQKG